MILCSPVRASFFRSPAVPVGMFARGILRTVAVGRNIFRPFQLRHVGSQSADASAFAWFVVGHLFPPWFKLFGERGAGLLCAVRARPSFEICAFHISSGHARRQWPLRVLRSCLLPSCRLPFCASVRLRLVSCRLAWFASLSLHSQLEFRYLKNRPKKNCIDHRVAHRQKAR